MRRVIAAATLCGLVMAVGLSGSAGAAAKAKQRSFTQTFVGGQISGTAVAGEQAYKFKDSLSGKGAAIQAYKISGTAFPFSGTDTTTLYFGTGVVITKDTFTLGAPDAAGISAITGKGKCTGGSGKFKALKCTYTFTGTYDTKTTISKVTVKGSETGL